MAIKDFRDLDVWQQGMHMVQKIYDATERFPKDEKFGLASQMTRSAVSIPSNIAEGFNRRHNREYRQFLYISLGSCAELETQCEIAASRGYISGAQREDLLRSIQYESRMLTKLIACLK